MSITGDSDFFTKPECYITDMYPSIWSSCKFYPLSTLLTNALKPKPPTLVPCGMPPTNLVMSEKALLSLSHDRY